MISVEAQGWMGGSDPIAEWMSRSESFWPKVQDGEQPFAGRATGHSTTCRRPSSFCTSLRQSFSQRPGSRSGSTAANTDAQTAQQSTRSERRDRCLVNAHFNLNEPRTALRKHKDEKSQRDGGAGREHPVMQTTWPGVPSRSHTLP